MQSHPEFIASGASRIDNRAMAVPEDGNAKSRKEWSAMNDLQVISTDELEDEAILELPAREAMSLINTTVIVVVDVDINQCHQPCRPCHPCK
jgi:hypothetical protein